MIKMEVFKDMMNSENAPVIAGIAGIVALVGIDRITKRNYKTDATKDSVSLRRRTSLGGSKAIKKTPSKTDAAASGLYIPAPLLFTWYETCAQHNSCCCSKLKYILLSAHLT